MLPDNLRSSFSVIISIYTPLPSLSLLHSVCTLCSFIWQHYSTSNYLCFWCFFICLNLCFILLFIFICFCFWGFFFVTLSVVYFHFMILNVLDHLLIASFLCFASSSWFLSSFLHLLSPAYLFSPPFWPSFLRLVKICEVLELHIEFSGLEGRCIIAPPHERVWLHAFLTRLVAGAHDVDRTHHLVPDRVIVHHLWGNNTFINWLFAMIDWFNGWLIDWYIDVGGWLIS